MKMASENYPVSSSWIESVDYDPQTSQLTGHFVGGRSFTLPVDKSTFDAFINAPSKGRFWNQNFK